VSDAPTADVVRVSDADEVSGTGGGRDRSGRSGDEARAPGADGTTVVPLPARIVIDLTDDDAEPGAAARTNGDNVIPIGARR
jgi:hypothetical protein